jgi:hypothetical protein
MTGSDQPPPNNFKLKAGPPIGANIVHQPALFDLFEIDD